MELCMHPANLELLGKQYDARQRSAQLGDRPWSPTPQHTTPPENLSRLLRPADYPVLLSPPSSGDESQSNDEPMGSSMIVDLPRSKVRRTDLTPSSGSVPGGECTLFDCSSPARRTHCSLCGERGVAPCGCSVENAEALKARVLPSQPIPMGDTASSAAADCLQLDDDDTSPEYFVSIVKNLLAKKESKPEVDYLSRPQNQDLKPEHRTILVDWVCEVAHEWGIKDQAVFHAVSFIDRFLSATQRTVGRKDLQLVGVCSLMISVKLEEVEQPSVMDFVEITANSYTPEEISRMELVVLNTLKCRLLSPTIVDFTGAYLRMFKAQRGSNVWNYAHYVSEAILHSAHLTPSFPVGQLGLACVIIALASQRLDFGEMWRPWMAELAPWRAEELQAVVDAVLSAFLQYHTGDLPGNCIDVRYATKEHFARGEFDSLSLPALPFTKIMIRATPEPHGFESETLP